MPRAVRHLAGAIAALALLLMAPAALAEDAAWKTFDRPALGLSMQRPADLYELDPEAPADDVNGEVEWGPTDHAWSILITSQALKPGQSLAALLDEEKKRNPDAEAAPVKIGNGVEAVRVWALDEDALSVLVLLLDKTGGKLIAIELSIALAEDDAGKNLASLRISYNGTIKLFERMLETVKITKG